MDNKIIPIRPNVPLGRPEPQLPKLTPRDLTLARQERQRTLRERRRPRQFPGWLYFVYGILTARLFDYIELAIKNQ